MFRLSRASFGVASLLIAFIDPASSPALEPTENKQPGEESTIAADAVREIVEGGNRFAMDLYAQLCRREGNIFLSPSSISMALAMTCAGAAGITQQEMVTTLHLPMPAAERDEGMRTLLETWTRDASERGYRLRVANRLWGQQSSQFLPAFLDITRTQYGAELARLDFAHATEESRQTINRWVEEQTERKITDLIPASALTRDSQLVLTNAVYFKGDWTTPFKSELTKDDDFQITSNQTVKTPLMQREGDFRYAAADGLQVLELPYGDKSLAMVVLLPEEGVGLAQLETQMSFDNLQKWTTMLRAQDVLVYLPKFKTTAQFDLNPTLIALGMSSAFEPSSADFSGMTGGKNLFISKVVHKAFVDVNEEGTEAAAATGVLMAPTAVRRPQPKPVFRADHPFLFLIRDNRNGAILFLGRLTNPTL